MLLPKTLVKSVAKVLIVEDQEAIRLTLRHMLEMAGFKHIEEAENGRQGMHIIEMFRPDIILLDIMMPEMDGFEMCRRLKNNPKTADIPVLFLTGLDDAVSRTAGYKLGAVDYINKPLQTEEMLARTETHIHNGMLKHQLQVYFDRVSTELKMARQFQTRLLPTPQQLSRLSKKYNIKLEAIFQPSQELAGDYWQVFELDDQNLALTLLDFTGHGVAAALNTATAHGLFQELEADFKKPLDVVHALNRQLRKILAVDSFATCFYGVLNTKSKTLTYAKSGAMPIAHLPAKQGEQINYLSCRGYPLGVCDEADFDPELANIKLKKGESLLLYSDALPESKHKGNDEDFRWLDSITEHNIQKALKEAGTDMLKSLHRTFDVTARRPLQDDLTLIHLTV